MVDLFFEGVLSAAADSVDRRLHTRRMRRFATKQGLRYAHRTDAPNMASALGRIASGRLENILFGRLDGGEMIAWERPYSTDGAIDTIERRKSDPSGHFVAVPVGVDRPNLVAQAWHPLTVADECPWLAGASRMRLQSPKADRLFRVTAADHGFAQRLIDEDRLLARPRRSWAVLGGWAVCVSPNAIALQGKRGLRSELAFAREIAARCARV